MPESEATLAVVVARLDDLRTDVQGLRTELHTAQASNVSRGEWGQRNTHVDSRLDALGREVGDLRTETRAARAPWWSWAAVLLAVASFGWSVLAPVITSPETLPEPEPQAVVRVVEPSGPTVRI